MRIKLHKYCFLFTNTRQTCFLLCTQVQKLTSNYFFNCAVLCIEAEQVLRNLIRRKKDNSRMIIKSNKNWSPCLCVWVSVCPEDKSQTCCCMSFDDAKPCWNGQGVTWCWSNSGSRIITVPFLPRDAIHSADYAVARCASVRLSVRHTPVVYRNSETYHHTFLANRLSI